MNIIQFLNLEFFKKYLYFINNKYFKYFLDINILIKLIFYLIN
jgi:hypothetical protein